MQHYHVHIFCIESLTALWSTKLPLTLLNAFCYCDYLINLLAYSYRKVWAYWVLWLHTTHSEHTEVFMQHFYIAGCCYTKRSINTLHFKCTNCNKDTQKEKLTTIIKSKTHRVCLTIHNSKEVFHQSSSCETPLTPNHKPFWKCIAVSFSHHWMLKAVCTRCSVNLPTLKLRSVPLKFVVWMPE